MKLSRSAKLRQKQQMISQSPRIQEFHEDIKHKAGSSLHTAISEERFQSSPQIHENQSKVAVQAVQITLMIPFSLDFQAFTSFKDFKAFQSFKADKVHSPAANREGNYIRAQLNHLNSHLRDPPIRIVVRSLVALSPPLTQPFLLFLICDRRRKEQSHQVQALMSTARTRSKGN